MLLLYACQNLKPKNLGVCYSRLQIEAQNCTKPSIYEVFQHCNFRGRFGVVDVFYFKSHTYNCLVNGHQALILPKLETWTFNFGTEGVHVNKKKLHSC